MKFIACVTRVARKLRYTGIVANLTITVDENVLRRARIRALERNESVNRFLAETLERYAEGTGGEAASELIALARSFATGHVGQGRGWARADLHRV